MAENTGIGWTDHTYNPWIGCTKISDECLNCYAEVIWDKRRHRVEWGGRGAAPRPQDDVPGWDKKAVKAGERRRVFCASHADVFDNHRSIAPEWRTDLWALIDRCRNLDWLLLTKRPQNFRKMLPPNWGNGWPHVWLGVHRREPARGRSPSAAAAARPGCRPFRQRRAAARAGRSAPIPRGRPRLGHCRRRKRRGLPAVQHRLGAFAARSMPRCRRRVFYEAARRCLGQTGQDRGSAARSTNQGMAATARCERRSPRRCRGARGRMTPTAAARPAGQQAAPRQPSLANSMSSRSSPCRAPPKIHKRPRRL